MKDLRVKAASRKFNIILLVGSLIVSIIIVFMVGEVYIRFTRPYETSDTLRKESLEYEATLFARHAFPKKIQTIRLRDGAGFVKINNKGYRGKDFQVPKPKKKIRILFLGGSAAFDTDAPEDKDWPHLVEKGLWESGHKKLSALTQPYLGTLVGIL